MTQTASQTGSNTPSQTQSTSGSSSNKNDNVNVIEIALSLLKTEAQGLEALGNSLDENFIKAVELIHNKKQPQTAQKKQTKQSSDSLDPIIGQGRLIVAGIGKSGHVARKIAATLASTGTPAYFVHPGEASHGDMGMITNNDVVLMLSNSGENSELSDLIHYTRRYGITLIAMTSKKESTLGSHADICLLLPDVPEACPNGLAPTTSTTMMIALGDALAVALLESMSLTKEQYKVFHPGGKLGKKLMRVEEIMIKLSDLPLIENTKNMDEAILILSEKNLGCVIVTDQNGALEGIITDGDLKRHMDADLLQKPVSSVMSATPKSISPDALAAEALDKMTKDPGKYVTSLIVLDQNDKLAGMVRLQDCLQAGIA